MDDSKGDVFATVDRYVQDYGVRARELKKNGEKIIGYICSFVTLELIKAAPNKGAHDGFKKTVPFGYRFIDITPDTKGNAARCCDQF